jgi:hypothetical protein
MEEGPLSIFDIVTAERSNLQILHLCKGCVINLKKKKKKKPLVYLNISILLIFEFEQWRVL